jgi:DNA-binding FadR family transcriptional regulator
VPDAPGARTLPRDNTTPWGTDSVLTRDYQEALQPEHLVILNAITDSDPQAARDAMRAHLTASQERYRRRLRGQQAEFLAGVARARSA